MTLVENSSTENSRDCVSSSTPPTRAPAGSPALVKHPSPPGPCCRLLPHPVMLVFLPLLPLLPLLLLFCPSQPLKRWVPSSHCERCNSQQRRPEALVPKEGLCGACPPCIALGLEPVGHALQRAVQWLEQGK